MSLQQMAAFGAPSAQGGSWAGGAGVAAGGMWGGSGATAFAAPAGLASAGLPFPSTYLPSSMGAGMAGAPGAGSVFLPLLQTQALGAGMQQQFGFSLTPQQPALQPLVQQVKQEQQCAPSAFQPPQPGAAPQSAAQPTLRPIRTRAAAAVAAAPGQGSGSGDSGSMAPSVPAGGSGSGGPGLDLAGFLLSPLAASLLSPLGLNGSPAGMRRLGMVLGKCSGPLPLPPPMHQPRMAADWLLVVWSQDCMPGFFRNAGWKDSPLSHISTGQLARLLSSSLEGEQAHPLASSGTASQPYCPCKTGLPMHTHASSRPFLNAGSGGSGLSGLLSPGGARAGAPAGRHRLATEGTSGSPASAGGGSGSGRALSSAALARLFSSPTSEADLFSALQVWWVCAVASFGAERAAQRAIAIRHVPVVLMPTCCLSCVAVAGFSGPRPAGPAGSHGAALRCRDGRRCSRRRRQGGACRGRRRREAQQQQQWQQCSVGSSSSAFC